MVTTSRRKSGDTSGGIPGRSRSKKTTTPKKSNKTPSSSKTSEKNAGTILREARSEAKQTGGDPNQIAGRIAQGVIDKRDGGNSTPTGSTPSAGLSQDVNSKLQLDPLIEDLKEPASDKGIWNWLKTKWKEQLVRDGYNEDTGMYELNDTKFQSLGIGGGIFGNIGKFGLGKAGEKVAAKMIKESVKKGGTTALNTKTANTAAKIITSKLSYKSLVAAGGSLAAAGSLMYWGMWGQAEAPEPLSIAMNKVYEQARRTGNWELYQEAAEARDEIMDLDIWQNIVLHSPLAPLVGITNKLKGIPAAAAVMDKSAQIERDAQEQGLSSDEKWAKVREEEAAQDKQAVDYYNQQLVITRENERKAVKEQRNDDAAFWRKERESQRKKEAEDRKAIADFWEQYRRLQQKQSEDTRPSNLKFGLL